jgi:hypothetical protein
MGPCGFPQGEGGGRGGAAAGISLPYSSELNSVERVLKEVRRWVEVRRYDGIEVKQAAVKEGCCEDWRPSERSHHSWGGTISV